LTEEAGPRAEVQELFTPDFGQEEGPQLSGVADLEARVREILAQAEARREHIERQAYEEGFRQGQRDGREVGLKALEEVTRRLRDLLTELTGLRERLFREREEEMVHLALAVARQVVGRELQSDPGLIRGLLQRDGLRLHLHPGDLEVLSETGKEGWPPEVELVADAGLTPGGFRIETGVGELDGSLETRWERVARTVTAALEKARDDRQD
jgi:flagellar assembly protein FliH